MGILGATVMPHSLFLGSALATQDRISFRAPRGAGTRNTANKKETDNSLQNQPSEKVSHLRRLYEKFKKNILGAFIKPPADMYSTRSSYGERQNNSFEFVRAHIYYGMFDIVGSLFGFAVMINSLYVDSSFFFFLIRSFDHYIVFSFFSGF